MSHYQRHHYEDIATILKSVRSEMHLHDAAERRNRWRGVQSVEDQLMVLFRHDNPQFSMDRFRAAAGIPGVR